MPTIYVASATHGATNLGGTVRASYTHSSVSLEDRTGEDEYPTSVYHVDKGLRVQVTSRGFCDDAAFGCTEADLTVNLSDGCGTDVACVFSDMLLESVDASASRADFPEITYSFVHISSDGTSTPVA